jgi:hypothetical protein
MASVAIAGGGGASANQQVPRLGKAARIASATADGMGGMTKFCDLSAAYRKLLARRLARRCREFIHGCLREEEWLDAEDEFEKVIRAGLEDLEQRGTRVRD